MSCKFNHKKAIAIALITLVALVAASAIGPCQVIKADETATKFTVVMDEFTSLYQASNLMPPLL